MCALQLHGKRCSLGVCDPPCHDHDVVCSQITLTSISYGLQCGMDVLQFDSNLFSIVRNAPPLALLTHNVALPFHLRIYVYTPSPLYIYIFTRSHPQIYLSTSTHPHICTSISHLHIHTVTPSHPPSFSLFLHIFSLNSLNTLDLTSSQLLTQ